MSTRSRMGSLGWVSVTVAAVLATVASLTAAAGPSAGHGADLVIVSVASPPPTLAPGASFLERFREGNRGDRRARRSTTAFYLSRSRRLGAQPIRLDGTARIPKLGRQEKFKAKVRLTIPAGTPAGSYLLIACANPRHRLKERRVGNDCRTSRGKLTVTPGVMSPSIAVGPFGTEPGCVHTQEPTLTSMDPNCFDGDPTHGVFVSGLGDDANSGTAAAPKRTLGAGIATAAAQGDDVYVTEGVFPETLRVANGVSVFGGYDAAWMRSPSHVTKVVGLPSTSDAAAATSIDEPTTLQLLKLEPVAPSLPGANSYGLQGLNSPGLVLDDDVIVAAAGKDGQAASSGSQGPPGGEGHPAGGLGGSSTSGHTGGKGGYGGSDGDSGHEGEAGLATQPDVWGAMGGPGGPGGEGGSNPKPGGPGYAGDAGHRGADGPGGGTGNAAPGTGFWLTESGTSGQSGTAGHGGGGGGGGGSDGCTFGIPADGGAGGSGGGGGAGGGGGPGGQGGGGSFGIFLEGSSGAVVRASTVTAADGGDGGSGGTGGYAGAGGKGGEPAPGTPGSGACSAGAAAGGKGGNGGPGGLGGNGGGGAGGPSIAIYGIAPSDAPETTASHGAAGGGAPGAGGVGANGTAANFG